ncbi:uncharacterized protein LOC129598166 [Paramacrobiotus metropolitanus]|uniref:uncharacterized protein LOC129598166 n=1 Tax=Paramacrobiotus metropolitanus TaxID=2943436 RepID=UPI002445C9B8|nr:uncharacterized protein LOC129598166 [Paramacrobiotus metropolitanus]
MFLRISLIWMLAHSRTHRPIMVRLWLLGTLLLSGPAAWTAARGVGAGARSSSGALEGCQPSALVFCEMPVIASPSDQEDTFNAFPGEEFRLPCQAYGSPSPLITWHRVLANGESIPLPRTAPPPPSTAEPRPLAPPPAPAAGSHYVRNEAGTLRISHVVPHDGGVYYCVAENSAGTAKALVDVKVSIAPLVNILPLSVGDTYVVITWNGTVHVPHLGATSPPRGRHYHHVETRVRLGRHLFLKYRRYRPTSGPSDTLPGLHVIRLAPLSRQHRVSALAANTLYEFCMEFEPHGRPSTLLDCVTLRTAGAPETLDTGRGYHQGRTIMFVLLVAIVASVACLCFGCYAMAIGRKLWKYRSKKGFTALGYSEEADAAADPEVPGGRRRKPYSATVNHRFPSTDACNYADAGGYQEDNPKKPLIARI